MLQNLTSQRMREFCSFAAVGLFNTGVHFVVLVALVQGGMVAPSLANMLAFMCANVVSYCLNSRVTFRQASSVRHYMRFLVCSLLGAALAFLIARGVQAAHWDYRIGFVCTVLAMLPVNFYLVRRFAFTNQRAGSAPQSLAKGRQP